MWPRRSDQAASAARARSSGPGCAGCGRLPRPGSAWRTRGTSPRVSARPSTATAYRGERGRVCHHRLRPRPADRGMEHRRRGDHGVDRRRDAGPRRQHAPHARGPGRGRAGHRDAPGDRGGPGRQRALAHARRRRPLLGQRPGDAHPRRRAGRPSQDHAGPHRRPPPRQLRGGKRRAAARPVRGGAGRHPRFRGAVGPHRRFQPPHSRAVRRALAALGRGVGLRRLGVLPPGRPAGAAARASHGAGAEGRGAPGLRSPAPVRRRRRPALDPHRRRGDPRRGRPHRRSASSRAASRTTSTTCSPW